MPKRKVITIFTMFSYLLFSPKTSYTQSRQRIDQLATLAKTWGLLKYYHPAIASGNRDWDGELIISLKKILEADVSNSMNNEVKRLLSIAGPDTASRYTSGLEDSIIYRNFDNSWIKRSSLTSTSKQALWYILEHPFKGTNYYAQPSEEKDGYIIAPNEKAYIEMKHPDVYYRLLSLFRFWNVINYYYPYKYAIGKPWESVLNELIPQFIQANDSISYYKALSQMAASINDSHGGLWPQVFDQICGSYGVPFNFKIIGDKAVVTKITDSSAIMDSPLAVGCIIETIDGASIKERIDKYKLYMPASNEAGRLRDLHGIVLNGESKRAVLTGNLPGGLPFKATIERVKRNMIKEHLDFFEMTAPQQVNFTNDSIGYVFFSDLNKKNIDSTFRSLLNKKAIIFDMRNYPSDGYATYHAPDYLLSKPTPYAYLTRPDFSRPGTFIYEIANRSYNLTHVGVNNDNPYQGMVILLVDERTQSAAEWACMTLQTYSKVLVVGSSTAGADGNVTRIVLPGGYKINFSGLGIYYPDGRETQRVGIKVDVQVNPTISDIINKRDVVLGKALELIRK